MEEVEHLIEPLILCWVMEWVSVKSGLDACVAHVSTVVAGSQAALVWAPSTGSEAAEGMSTDELSFRLWRSG